MAVENRTMLSGGLKRTQQVGHPPSNVRFDWWMALLSSWFIFGIYLDGWAHSHLPESLESFLTPWHGVLYSGMLSIGFVLIYQQTRHVLQGYAWRTALPKGYGLSLLGFVAFVGAGLFDFAWHEAFGSEASIEALLSPAHLLLATSGFVVVTGPLRAAWHERATRRGWRHLFPVLISATLAVSVLTFFTEYVHFFSIPNVLILEPGAANTLLNLEDPRFFPNVFGVMSVLIPSLLLTATLLFLVLHWELPLGSLTFVIGVNSALMFFMSWGEVREYPGLLVALVATGILADALRYWLKPSAANLNALRVFAFSVPFIMGFLYMVVLNQSALAQTQVGLWWKIHMWLGVPFTAAIAGLLLSILIVPSRRDGSTI